MKASKTSLLTRFMRWEASGILIALVILMVALSLSTDNFLTGYNFAVVARLAAFVGLVAGLINDAMGPQPTTQNPKRAMLPS